MRDWIRNAVRLLDSDARRSADTHLYRLNVPRLEQVGIDIYLKDETTHPTGSLKHRLARSLFLHAICSGKIDQNTPVVEASSGSTAISEAWFARLLGLPFTAVVGANTAKKKIEKIEQYGGQCHFVEQSCEVYQAAEKLAAEVNGHYMDQFTYAESATDWRGNNNIAESIYYQMAMERHTIPHTIVMSAGTGGTSATLGRYIRYKGYATQLLVVDPENSVYYDAFQQGRSDLTINDNSRIEGIGRPRVEPSFVPGVIDRMLKVEDKHSMAAVHWMEKLSGRKVGASTGTNLWGVMNVAEKMLEAGEKGAIVTLICDSGERYLDTYFNPAWIKQQFGSLDEPMRWLEKFNWVEN